MGPQTTATTVGLFPLAAIPPQTSRDLLGRVLQEISYPPRTPDREARLTALAESLKRHGVSEDVMQEALVEAVQK